MWFVVCCMCNEDCISHYQLTHAWDFPYNSSHKAVISGCQISHLISIIFFCPERCLWFQFAARPHFWFPMAFVFMKMCMEISSMSMMHYFCHWFLPFFLLPQHFLVLSPSLAHFMLFDQLSLLLLHVMFVPPLLLRKLLSQHHDFTTRVTWPWCQGHVSRNLLSPYGFFTWPLCFFSLVDDLPPIAAASMWTRKDIREFKDSIRKDPDSVIKVGSGETVTVSRLNHA